MTARLYRDAGQVATLGTPPIVLPLGQGGRRHDAGQLRHLLPHPAAGARAVAASASVSTSSARPSWSRSSAASSASSTSSRSRPTSPGATPRSSGAGPRRWAGRATSCTATCAAASARACARSAARPGAKQHTGVTYVPARLGGRRHDVYGRARRSASSVAAARARGVEARTARRRAAARGVRARRRRLRARSTRRCSCAAAGSAARRASWAATSRSTRARRCAAIFEERRSRCGAACRSPTTSTSSRDEGIMLEGAAGPPDYVAMPRSRARAPEHRDADGALPAHEPVRDDGLRHVARRACAQSLGRPQIPYDLDPRRRARASSAASRLLCEIYWAAGAREVIVPSPACRSCATARRGRSPARRCARASWRSWPSTRSAPRARAPTRPPRWWIGTLARARRGAASTCSTGRGAVVARGQPADHDHGPGHAGRLRPARRAGAGRARARAHGRAPAGDTCGNTLWPEMVTRDRRSARSPPSRSTSSSSAAASPAPGWRWTRPRRGFAVALVEKRDYAAGTSAARPSSSTAGCATCRTSTSGSCARRCSSASCSRRSPRTWCDRCSWSCPPSRAAARTASWAWG